MKELQIVRRYEGILIFCSCIGYVLISLIKNASHFDTYIQMARYQGVRVSAILNDLYEYNNIIDYNIPISFSAVFTLLAWFLFHYLAYPKIQKQGWNNSTLGYLALTGLLILLGSYILKYYPEYFDHRINDSGQIIGFKVYSEYRVLSVITTTISTFTLFCIYEMFAQLLYKLYSTENLSKSLYYFILAILLIADLLIIFNTAFAIIYSSFGLQQFLSFILGGIVIFELQNYFSSEVIHRLRESNNSEPYLLNLAIYFMLCLVGSVLVWGQFSNFGQTVEPKVFYPITLILLVLFPIMISYINQKEKKVLQTAISNTSAELTNLRSQINPHFLFNALNSLYATALSENSEKTADGIQKLGDMMRFMLHENNHERIPLSSEIAYLRNYIEIQRMRLDETQNIEIKINIQEPGPEISIAPMLLNPFIENAFKHGISLRNPSWIYITLTLDARKIYFKVHNSVHPSSGNNPEEQNHGIGLENVEKRLKLIYPGRHELYIQKSAQDYFVSLVLDY